MTIVPLIQLLELPASRYADGSGDMIGGRDRSIIVTGALAIFRKDSYHEVSNLNLSIMDSRL